MIRSGDEDQVESAEHAESTFANAKRDLFTVMADEDDDDDDDDNEKDDKPMMQSLSAPRAEEPPLGDTAARLEELQRGIGSAGDFYSQLKEDINGVLTSSTDSATSSVGPPPPPPPPPEVPPPTSFSGGGDLDTGRPAAASSAFDDSVSHGIIRSAAAAAAGNLPSSPTSGIQEEGDSWSGDDSYDGEEAMEYDEKKDDLLAGKSFRDKRSSSGDHTDGQIQHEVIGALDMIRAAAEQGAESSTNAHCLSRVPLRKSAGSDVHFAPVVAEVAAAGGMIGQAEGSLAARVESAQEQMVSPPQASPTPAPQQAVSPPFIKARKLADIYKRASQVVKRGDTTGDFQAATEACAKLRRWRGADAMDRDLYEVAGLDPEAVDAPTLSEMRRLFRLEQGGALVSSSSGDCSVAEHVACEVLGQPLLKQWYDTGVRGNLLTQDRLIAQYKAEVERLFNNTAKQKQSQAAPISAARGAVLNDPAQSPRIANYTHQAPSSSSDSGSTPFVRSSAALLAAELEAHRTVAALSDELRETQVRLRELEKEISEQRQMRKALEMKLEGLDEAAMAREDSLLLVERANWARERDSFVATIAELRQKLSWYAENQTLLDAHLDENRTQRDTIHSLKQKLRDLHAEDRGNDSVRVAKSVRDSKKKGIQSSSSLQSARFGAGDGAVSRQELAQKDKRVRVLEGQLKRLQQQYEVGPAGGKAGRNESRNRKQSSDPMAALIEASRPTEATEAVLRKLKAEKRALEAEVETVRHESTLTLRSLKQQFTRLQLQYKEVAENLEPPSHPQKSNISSSSEQISRQDKVRLAEAEIKIGQLQRALAKKGAWMEQRVRQEKERCAKQIRAIKTQTDRRRRNDGAGTSRDCIYEIDTRSRPSEIGDLEAPLQDTSHDRTALSTQNDADASSTEQLKTVEQSLREALIEKSALEQDLKFAVAALEEERRKRFGPFGRGRQEEGIDESSKGGSKQGAPRRDSFDDVLGAEVGRLRTELEKATEERNKAAQAATDAAKRLNEEKLRHKTIVDELQRKLLLQHAAPTPNDEVSGQEKEVSHCELKQSEDILAQAQANLRIASAAESKALERAANAEERAAEACAIAENLRNGGAAASVIGRHRDLEERLRVLERRAVEREAATTRLVDVARKQGKMELMRLRALHATELDDKDRRIDAFRGELDELLNVLRLATATAAAREPKAQRIS